MKFFVLTAESPTPYQRKAVTEYLAARKSQFGFWHWTADFWIISTTYEHITSMNIRDEIQKLTSGMSFAVFAVTPSSNDWAMYSNPKWSEWVEKIWK